MGFMGQKTSGDLKERIEIVDSGLKKLLEENRLSVGVNINFPIYKELPAEVQLALKVLEKHEVRLEIYYQEKEKNT